MINNKGAYIIKYSAFIGALAFASYILISLSQPIDNAPVKLAQKTIKRPSSLVQSPILKIRNDDVPLQKTSQTHKIQSKNSIINGVLNGYLKDLDHQIKKELQYLISIEVKSDVYFPIQNTMTSIAYNLFKILNALRSCDDILYKDSILNLKYSWKDSKTISYNKELIRKFSGTPIKDMPALCNQLSKINCNISKDLLIKVSDPNRLVVSKALRKIDGLNREHGKQLANSSKVLRENKIKSSKKLFSSLTQESMFTINLWLIYHRIVEGSPISENQSKRLIDQVIYNRNALEIINRHLGSVRKIKTINNRLIIDKTLNDSLLSHYSQFIIDLRLLNLIVKSLDYGKDKYSEKIKLLLAKSKSKKDFESLLFMDENKPLFEKLGSQLLNKHINTLDIYRIVFALLYDFEDLSVFKLIRKGGMYKDHYAMLDDAQELLLETMKTFSSRLAFDKNHSYECLKKSEYYFLISFLLWNATIEQSHFRCEGAKLAEADYSSQDIDAFNIGVEKCKESCAYLKSYIFIDVFKHLVKNKLKSLLKDLMGKTHRKRFLSMDHRSRLEFTNSLLIELINRLKIEILDKKLADNVSISYDKIVACVKSSKVNALILEAICGKNSSPSNLTIIDDISNSLLKLLDTLISETYKEYFPSLSKKD